MGEARILITRREPFNPHPYDVVLRWILKEHPALAPSFDVKLFKHRLETAGNIRLHAPWIQDPMEAYAPRDYAKALELEADCQRLGIRTLNPVSKHHHASKTESSKRFHEAGIRCAQTVLIESEEEFRDNVCGLRLPVLLRDNVVHVGELIKIDTLEEARSVRLDTFSTPALTEYVDVQSPDGLFRKYRSTVIGDTVVTNHMQLSRTWLNRKSTRLQDLQAREEEIAFLNSPEPRPDLMRSVLRALGADFGGVDYGIDREGNVIVWECNLYPDLNYGLEELPYRNFGKERVIANMIRYYLQLADIEVPAKMERQASYD